MSSLRPLVTGFLASADNFPDRPAVQIRQEKISYSQLRTLAKRIAGTLQAHVQSEEHALTGVFGHRSFAAFAGVLGSLLLGDAYVPLNPSFPQERTLQMIKRARLTKIVVEEQSLQQLIGILKEIDVAVVVLVIDADTFQVENDTCHKYLFQNDLVDESVFRSVDIDSEQLAYLLFTSGSTGQPKGVMVKQNNVTYFVDYIVSRYNISEKDRFSQTFDLTFDLSAFDMFVAWEKGACVCCPSQGEKLLPAKYIRSQEISIWFGVPSTAVMMKKLRMLKPGNYPTIRYSLFCGEALPLEVACAFQEAAPNSVLENLYGPTELTIACTQYRYDDNTVGADAEQGVVPIGDAYVGMRTLIVDEQLLAVAEGEVGELLMAGTQLTKGYWEDEEKTASAFVVPPGMSEVYYRTGDRVRRSTPDSPMVYLGRVDNQIKVQGYRVELGEIEARIRKIAKTDVAIAIGYPMGINGAEGIIAFKGESELSDIDVAATLNAALPSYMQPKDLVTVNSFPLNANGKVDRKALLNSYLDKSGEQ